jgi:ribosomal protein S18 acetylase RimI-like enzyme
MEIVDLRDRRDEDLLRVVHDGLYATSFPLEEEREGLVYWLTALWGVGQDGRGPSVHALVAGTDLSEPSERRIAGLAFVELYLESGCGLLSYVAVDPDFRRVGLGRELVTRGLEVLRRDADEQGKPLRAVFAEVHDPDAAAESPREEVMDPTERVSFFAKLGGRRIPIPYVQPALARGSGRARGLQLIVLCSEAEKRTLRSAVVRDFVTELYERSEDRPPSPNDPEFRAMTQALAADSIQLAPLNAIIEEPAFHVQRYGIAFEFVTRSDPLAKLPDPAEQFASFESDVLSYAFQGRRPFASKPVHVPDPCRRVEIEFAPEVGFLSEGRTCALVAEDAPVDGRRVWVQVRASWTRFRTGVTVWHLVLTPRAGPTDIALNEYDVIKLAKHWMGGEDIKGPYAVSGAEAAVRFSRDEETWTLSELAHDVIGDELKGASPRAGIIQLITGDDDPEAWREAWEVIRAAKEEPAIDTSFPFKRPEQRLLVESIAGVIQTLIDFREIDDAELRDVLAGMDVGEDGMQGVHKGTLLYMAASDRTWGVSKLSYGISPYLLLPHAVLLHNEEILRTADAAVQRERDAVKELSATRTALGRPSERGRLSHLLRMPFLARTFARHVRKERKTLRAVREELHRGLQRDYLPNVFHYPNERHIYEVGETSRGLSALAQELRESLDEFDARWEGGASMRRTMADDIKAGLLFAIAGFALKDYLNPVALVAIFGLCGLIYVGFRFYTWR